MVAEISVGHGTPQRASLALRARPGGRRLRFMGPLRGPRPDWLDCVAPVHYVSDSGRVVPARCNSHRARTCAPCASRYRSRVKRLVHDGIDHLRGRGLQLGMLTFTAPGENDHRGTNFVGGPRPPGLCPCTSSLGDPGLWNADAGRRWNHLRTLLRRQFPGLEFFRAVEFQDRGLIHLHVVVAHARGLDHDALQWIRATAIHCGFGCSTDYRPDVSPTYVSKYVSKSLDDKHAAPWTQLDETTGELTPVVNPRFRTSSTSHGWPIRMAEIVAAQRDSARRYAAALNPWDDETPYRAETPEAGARSGVPPDPLF